MSEQKVSILLIDSQQLFLDGLAALIGKMPGMHVIASFSNPVQGLHAFKVLNPEVTILGDCCEEMHTLTIVQEIKLYRKNAKIIITAGSLQEFVIMESIRAGVMSFVSRTQGFSLFERALAAVVRGEHFYGQKVSSILAHSITEDRREPLSRSIFNHLTKREKEIMIALLSGQSINTIAASLNISHKTVATHKSKIFRKFNIKSMLDLARLGSDFGF